MDEPQGAERPAGSVVLGVSCDYHDAAAAVVIDGVVAAAAQEERFSRVKHDHALPVGAIEACLATAGVEPGDVDHLAFYEKPLAVAARFLATRHRQGLTGIKPFVADAPNLVGRNLLIGYRLRRSLARMGAWPVPNVRYVEHHMSHAAAAFHPSPFADAAILTVDGIGEWATATIARGDRTGISLLEEVRFPRSVGLLYSLVTTWCGFEANDGEYKVMGLAPYGEPRFVDAWSDVIDVGEHGELEIDAKGLEWYGSRAHRSERVAALFGGPPRAADQPITQREADLAASIQVVTERAMLGMARRAERLTGRTNLCMAGGVALNCVANGRILREGPFEQLWVQPAAGDAGSAIGAALALWHGDLRNPREAASPDGMSGALLGPRLETEAARTQLGDLGVEHRSQPDPQALADEVAQALADGKVVARVVGRSEFGPRALGHRSLLADPRDPTMRDRLNLRVKGRESFRPFAPAVLAERAGEWFELDHPSPYMLIVAPVREEHRVAVDPEPVDMAERARAPRSTVPACTHIDGSARIQTVSAEADPELHRLISAFDALTGVPMVVNTSFNLAGEPIVETVEDAVRTAAAADVDLLVVDHHLVDRDGLAAFRERESIELVGVNRG